MKKITVFTSNQPRHISLINSLAEVSEKVYAIQECCTLFPGFVEDFFKQSEAMREYFGELLQSEARVFGHPTFLKSNVQSLSIKMHDLKNIGVNVLSEALDSDLYIVFGSSFIKGELADKLIQKKAINIHMGVSPYYRGSSCNFWAMQDRNYEYVGATIHLLSKGLDSGPMLFHAIPPIGEYDPFILGMKAVESAHRGLIKLIESEAIFEMKSMQQDKNQEIRYSKRIDFNDSVADEYLKNLPTRHDIHAQLKGRDLNKFYNPQVI